ncbi:unnamed protein product [Nesidiocoris tenuis]|uniref:Uncharacterized protein n=1 Tax=Nesidiocoris tenuis TaxID=355587 RepID=A0A6H5G3E2_9HEMI|nr:unnamed protein product [Nesidiocoris tenuis]
MSQTEKLVRAQPAPTTSTFLRPPLRQTIRVTRPSALGMALLVRTVCRNRLHVGRKRRLRWKISSRNNACGSRSNKIVRVPDAQRSFSTSKQFKHFWQQIRRVDICQPVRP